MSKVFSQCLLALLAGPLCFFQTVAAAATGQLVTTQWLQQNLSRADLLIIDASPGKLHAAGHIPGAVSVDVFTYGARDMTTAEKEKQVQSWGVDSTRQIVIYDQGGGYLAPSLLFDLYYHGFPRDRLAVLDGGLAKWRATGGAVTKEPTPKPAPGTFRLTKVEDEVRARLPEFLAASGDTTNSSVVEALSPGMHFGAEKFFDRAGHVPNAISTPTEDFFNDDKTFKSPEELRRMFAYLGVTPDRHVYSHCGGGIAATVPFFAMKFMLDYPDVKLYKESQIEYLRDDRGLPLWTYDEPTMVREKTWLAGWNARMLRMFGVSRLSVVDIRPAAAFGQSHVPFAINVPAEVFRRDLASPAKLAEYLGAAGIDMSEEAVIVSNGGLNPDSALAYLALEQLGQKKVSVLSDSVDDWAFAGLPVDRAAEAAGVKLPANSFTSPKPYPAQLRAGIVTSNPAATKGLYPKVYVAAGKSVPMHVPAGNVVHVPYTDLVNTNGTPKDAKDIWAALVKAGVPRYAEIVSFSDDPGEAAANYFVFKLMGYPDVKVWVM
ncbi:MAG TPA: rhodanese-like domain-containing protein [Usitatibacter sp.]|nr:rhodanese-like domain-containing protein [Usitatibacter sp.]